MTRLALPVVLTVVVAYSSVLHAGCNHPAHASDCGCNESAPPAYNTNFPGTCRECLNGFAYSVWADYCHTKRYGPAYRIPRSRGCTSCSTVVHGQSVSGSTCDTPATHHSSVVEPIAVSPSPVVAQPSPSNTVVPRPSPPVPSTSYFGEPRKIEKPALPEPNHDESLLEEPKAEIDETALPEAPADDVDTPVAPMPVESDIDAIKRSVDEAVEDALESANGNSRNFADEQRSANYRQPWLKIFRPKNR